MNRIALALSVLVLAGATGCGSDEDREAGGETSGTTTGFVTTTGASTPMSPDDVEEALAAELGSGGGGGVHELENEPPRQISCRPADARTKWRCTLEPARGDRDVVCIVTVDSATRTVSKRECGGVDN